MSLGQDLFFTYWTFYSVKWKSFLLKVFAVGKVDSMEQVKLGIHVCQTDLKPSTSTEFDQRKWKFPACLKSRLSEWRFVTDLPIIYAVHCDKIIGYSVFFNVCSGR